MSPASSLHLANEMNTIPRSSSDKGIPFLFHRSQEPLKIGDILSGRGLPNNDQRIEDALEARRPPSIISRRNAVFMSADQASTLNGVHGSWVYRFKPIGEVYKADNQWYGQLQKAIMKEKYKIGSQAFAVKGYPDWTDELVDQTCRNYWSGQASDAPNWEYFAARAEVIGLVSAPDVSSAPQL